MPRNRNRRTRSNQTDDLNLTPFMNMVVVLIPLLLMSVVFLKVGVINVSAPPMVPAQASDGESEDLGLTVAIADDGFEVATSDETFGPIDGCPDDGPTVCLADPEVDVAAKVAAARRAIDRGKKTRGESLLQEVAAAYDFAALYSELRALKADHPGESSVQLTASPDMPYELLVRVMDAIRFELDQNRYASNEAFWKASTAARGGGRPDELFSRPVLAIGK